MSVRAIATLLTMHVCMFACEFVRLANVRMHTCVRVFVCVDLRLQLRGCMCADQRGRGRTGWSECGLLQLSGLLRVAPVCRQSTFGAPQAPNSCCLSNFIKSWRQPFNKICFIGVSRRRRCGRRRTIIVDVFVVNGRPDRSSLLADLTDHRYWRTW